MATTVKCPGCEKSYHVQEQSLGGRAKCKHCGTTFTLTPTAEETPQVAPAASASDATGTALDASVPAGDESLPQEPGTAAARPSVRSRSGTAPRRRSSGGVPQRHIGHALHDLWVKTGARLGWPWWAWAVAGAVPTLLVACVLGYLVLWGGKSPAKQVAAAKPATGVRAVQAAKPAPVAKPAPATKPAPASKLGAEQAPRPEERRKWTSFPDIKPAPDTPEEEPEAPSATPAAKTKPDEAQPAAKTKPDGAQPAAEKPPVASPPSTQVADAEAPAAKPSAEMSDARGSLRAAVEGPAGPGVKPPATDSTADPAQPTAVADAKPAPSPDASKPADAKKPVRPRPAPARTRPAGPSKASVVASTAKPTLEEPEELLAQALGQKTSVEFKGTPLTEAVDYLRDLHHLPILFDRRALDDVGVARDTPVTFSAKEISLEAALKQLLASLDLVWMIRDDVILITTHEHENRWLLTKVYALSSTGPAPGTPVPAMVAPGAISAAIDQLIQGIIKVVAPTSWDSAGGPASCAFASPGGANVLVISQTREVHRQIDDFLRQRGLLALAKKGRAMPIVKAASGAKLKAGSVEQLERAVEDKYTCEFVEAPLSEVADQFNHAAHLSLQLDRKALEEIGVAADAPISFQAKDLSLRSTLNLLLRDLNLTWLPQEGSLLITSLEAADKRMTLQSYPVADLAGPAITRSGAGNRITYTAVDYLPKMIQQTVAPVTWDAVGGPGSLSIASTPGGANLAVRQNYRVGLQVAKLLEELRHAAARNLGKKR